jgi:GDP-L-fucose synthase
MYLDDKLVFVAGGAGLVGANVINYLLQTSPTTRIRATFYRHTAPFIQHDRLEYVYADLTSAQECYQMVQGCDCAIMAAFANAGGVGLLTAHPWPQVTDNIIINTQLLAALAAQQVKRIICLGSITLYQEFEGHISENELDLNQDPYPAYFGIGWTARFIEKLCQFWHQQAGLETIIVRTANIFGPYAKFDPQSSNFIPAIIRKAVDRLDPFEVWGTANVTRDVIYVEDYVRALVMLLNTESIKFDIFNIGSGSPTTVGQVVEWALQAAGHQPQQLVYRADKPTSNQFKALNCSKIQRALNWQPEYTIEEGVKKTTAWWIENKHWWQR